MSLGLGDLKKRGKKTTPKNRVKSSRPYPNTQESGAFKASVSSRSFTARPWSDTDLSRAPSSGRRRVQLTDVAMSNEWLNIEFVYPFDFFAANPVVRMHAELALLEYRLSRRVLEQIEALLDWCGLKTA